MHLSTQSHSGVPYSMVTTHRGNDVGTDAVVAECRELVSGIAGHDCNTEWWAPKGNKIKPLYW